MPFTMFDSVTPSALPASGFDATAGYVNGKYQSSPGLVKRFPGLPHVTITVFASGDAMCLDVELGDATPADVPAWLDRQYARGVKLPIVYCNAGDVAAVRAACGSRPFLIWSADWTYTPHITPGADATQFADKGPAGENVDQTAMSARFLNTIAGKEVAPMADYERLIATARAEEGTHEGVDSAGSWNNDQKYSKELPGFAWSNFQPWCDTFVAWCFWKSGLVNLLGQAESASVLTSYQAWLAIGRFTEYPTKGAQVIYGQSKHTGICVDFDNTYIWVTEGNTNDNGSAEGNGVYFKRRLRTDPYVTGYGVPAFPDGVVISADPTWHHPTAVDPPPVKPPPPVIPTPPPVIPTPPPVQELTMADITAITAALADLKATVDGYGARVERIDEGAHGGWGYGRRIENIETMLAGYGKRVENIEAQVAKLTPKA